MALSREEVSPDCCLSYLAFYNTPETHRHLCYSQQSSGLPPLQAVQLQVYRPFNNGALHLYTWEPWLHEIYCAPTHCSCHCSCNLRPKKSLYYKCNIRLPKTLKTGLIDRVDETGTFPKLQDLKTLKERHEAAAVLSELIEKDGAGAWPPRAKHDSWPKALQPYKDIYLELNPLLPLAEPSLDHNFNEERCNKYRSLMRKLFAERVNIAQVETLMAAAEAGNWDIFPQDAYNGFYCAVAICRHAYR